MRKKCFLLSFTCLIIAFIFCACEKDDFKPTVPSALSGPDDKAIVTATATRLAAWGSNTDYRYRSKYRIYYGKSLDSMKVADEVANVKLEPYTQYFWYAKCFLLKDDTEIPSDPSPIRTFYCIPPITIETDNGDGEWSAIIRFKEIKDVLKSGRIIVTPDKEGFPHQEVIEITEGQDTCCLLLGNTNAPTNAAYTHWWDDKKGVLYEPIIYDFKMAFDIEVGDAIFTLRDSAREIILDKSNLVKDHEFNVYRLVKIGNQTWFAEDFRATSIVIDGKIYPLESVDYSSIGILKVPMYKKKTLKSGAQGIVYYCSINPGVYAGKSFLEARFLMEYAIPKGFRIPTYDDWYALEEYYGVSNPTIYKTGYYPYVYMMPERYDTYSADNKYNSVFIGNDTYIRDNLALFNEDWLQVDGKNEVKKYSESLFNARPFAGDGYGCIYWTSAKGLDQEFYYYSLVALSSFSGGICNEVCTSKYPEKYYYTSIRLIKE